MESQDLFNICILAFFWVFSVLTVLAIIMRLLTRMFPPKDSETDLPIYSAISAAMTQIIPGSKVTKIEEIK